MAWKLLLELIFNTATGKSVAMYVKKTESGMVQFTNEWYLFNRDGKLVLKNLEKGLVFETSADLAEPIDPSMIEAIKSLMVEEFGITIATPIVEEKAELAAANPKKGRTNLAGEAPMEIKEEIKMVDTPLDLDEVDPAVAELEKLAEEVKTDDLPVGSITDAVLEDVAKEEATVTDTPSTTNGPATADEDNAETPKVILPGGKKPR